MVIIIDFSGQRQTTIWCYVVVYIWTNSKQDGELINTYDKENTESREDTKIYAKIPCGKKPRVPVRQFYYEMKQI